jgi:hypothetical protein
MKTNKTKLILAALLSMAAISVSNAATVYMTGSTALRSTVFNSIRTAGVIFTGVPATTTYNGSSPSGANYMGFVGTATAANGGGTLTLKCHWSGSEAGIHDVASGLSQTFIADSLLDGADHGTAVPGTTETHIVDLAMADNAQSFSQYSTTRGFPNVAANNSVGVITFTFVRNPGVWTGNNISSAQFRAAQGGFATRGMFDGDPTHNNDYVYISGRDRDSGTRVNCFGDTGYGIFTTAGQIEIDGTGNMIPGPGGQFVADFGFSSGGTLAGTMSTSTVGKNDPWQGTTGLGFSVIGYMSRGDADSCLPPNGTATELTYNGVAMTRANVIEGTFTYWGNAYILQRTGAPAPAPNIYTSLGPNGGIDGSIGTGNRAIRFSDMHSTRQGPTSDVLHN